MTTPFDPRLPPPAGEVEHLTLADSQVEVALVSPPGDSEVQYLTAWVGSRGAGRNTGYDRVVVALLTATTNLKPSLPRMASVTVERRRDARPADDRVVVTEREGFFLQERLDWQELSPDSCRRHIGKLVAAHGRPLAAKGGGNRQKGVRFVWLLCGGGHSLSPIVARILEASP